jgi:flagellar motility protein MotE (MotC chaperone)
MGRLLGMLSSIVIYLCVGSMITLCLLVGYGFTKGYLDKDKLNKMVAVAQGLDAVSASNAADAKKTASSAEIVKQPDTPEQPSLEEIEAQRAVQARHLELREQSLDNHVQQLHALQSQLDDDKQTYLRQKTAFEKQLAQLHDGAVATGRDNIRQIWENIKPKQAKDQIVQMIDTQKQDDVVAILNAMPITKRAKIIGEFKTDDDNKKLEQILDLIRQGMPDEKIINNTQQQLNQVAAKPAG